jgi:hypothetical protein
MDLVMNTTPDSNQRQPKNRTWLYIFPILALLLLTLIVVSNESPTLLEPKELVIPTDLPRTNGPLEVLLFEQLPELVNERFNSDWRLIDIQFNEDSTQAMLWMAETDSDGEILAREPLLILATLNFAKEKWSMYTAIDDDFGERLLDSDFGESELADSIFLGSEPKSPTGIVYGGYYLPWEAGLTKRVTWSVGHTSCTPQSYCYYAFDFADGTMFDIAAAKGGFVYHWRDTCSNNNKSCTNSITLEDRTTSPWTYQIYLHLAYNSIPEELKKEGTYVNRGQFLGKADNTGYSTGHHLHFMVVEKETLNKCRYYCFGKAVDITFRDVDINWHEGTKGGRPRLESEARRFGGQGSRYYTSQNKLDNSLPNSLPYKYYLFPIFKH